jgi:serine/threonine protein kinase/DNA-binding winged helix-turn-helix (wHTH) protein/tetratricopeptide (TPR) repeat protein
LSNTPTMEDRYLDRVYVIAGRVIDPIGGTITHADQRTQIKRKHLQVLACLTSAGTAMVPREAFIDLVWRGNALIGENGLNSSVHALRRALHDIDADKPLIRTITRRGYQLTVAAGEVEEQVPAAFTPGMSISGKPGWQLSRRLGGNAFSGNAFSEIWLAEKQASGERRAFRFCRSEQHLQALRRETKMLRYLRQALAGRRDITVVLDWQLDEPPYHLEMDYASGGSLTEWANAQGGIARVALAERLRLMGEVAEALAAVHAADVVHRTLGPASILIDEEGSEQGPHAKLGEFALSDLTDRSHLTALQISSAGLTLTGENVGDALYLAPERLAGHAATAASDVYALGVLLLQMAVGDLQRTPADAWKQEIDSLPLRELIAACTSAAPEARPKASVIFEWLRAFAQAAHDAKRTDATASHATASPSHVPAQTPEAPAPTAPVSTASEPAPSEPTPSDPAIGGHIGPYRLLGQLGEGGMGVVYLAEQLEPVQRKVALKVVRTGMMSAEVRARFEAERQALARMHHANVASVFDAGSTPSGQPYFVMEYVQGQEITAHCDRQRLDFRARVTLFLQVCEGVLHAHQKGLVHRDLKPGNILVSRTKDQPGTVKIIDFGVAKSMSGLLASHPAHTRLGSFVGTPVYGSPEQISGPIANVDTRADIYSLGVVLYELLAGVTPYSEEALKHKTPLELVRLLGGERPPSALIRFAGLSREEEQTIAERRSLSVDEMKSQLGADLSWIVGKCLEVDPDDRYPSVLELEKDLRRWLNEEPIEARPTSRIYRLRKFARRHRTGVALSSVMTLALLITTATAVHGLLAARRATVEAEKVADFYISQMRSIDASAMGNGMQQALIGAVEKRGARLGWDPATLAQAQKQFDALTEDVNYTDLTLGQLDNYSFKPAMAGIKQNFGDSPLLQARLWQSLADTQLNLGQYEAAIEPQRLAFEQRLRLLGPDDPLTLISMRGRADSLRRIGQKDGALHYAQAAATEMRRVLGDDHPETLSAIVLQGIALLDLGEAHAAEQLFREAVAGQRRVLGNDHVETLRTVSFQSRAASRQHKHKEAVAYGQEGLSGYRRTLGSSNQQTLLAMSRLGRAYLAMGKYPEAEGLLREALSGYDRKLGESHPNTWRTMEALSEALMSIDRPDEANIYWLKVLEQKRKFMGFENSDTYGTITALGHVLRANGRFAEAESTYRKVIAGLRRFNGEDAAFESRPARDLMGVTINLAGALRGQGKLDEAITLYRSSLEESRRKLGDEHPSTFLTKELLASTLRMKGDISAADALHAQALQTQRLAPGNSDPDTLATMRRLTGNLWPDTLALISDAGARAEAQGNLEQAEALLREALAGQRRKLGSHTVDTLFTIDRLSRVLARRGQLKEASTLEKELAEHDWPKPLHMRDKKT